MKESTANWRGTFLIGAGLILLVLAAFAPVRQNSFVEFDDNQYLFENPHIRDGLSAATVAWAFTSGYAANWHPVTWLSHALDVQCFGLNPVAHHWHNVALHAIATALLFGLLNRLTGANWRSAFVAALFAIHPLRVESVAWAAERKDVLSAVFFMLTLWTYAAYASCKTWRRYLACLLCFTLGLMSKPMLVTLPLVMLILDFWPLQRISNFRFQISSWRLVVEKIPFLTLAFASCLITYLVQQQGRSMSPDLPLAFRIANALTSCTAYLGKLAWPANLAVLYPYPVAWPLWKPLAAGLLLALWSAFVWHRRSRQPWLVAGWCWFLVVLLPVIGLVQVGAQSMADRYTYLPSIGILILLVWGCAEFTSTWRWRTVVLGSYGALVIGALVIVTRAQVQYWRDSVALFSHAVAVTQHNFTMHHSLGWALAKEGRLDEAADQLRRSLEFRSDPETTLDLADVLIRQKNVEGAMPLLDKVLVAQPTNSVALYDKGIVHQTRGELAEATDAYEQAVRCDPNNSKAFNNLGLLKAQQGSVKDAEVFFRQSLRAAPDNARTRGNLAAVLQAQGRMREAADQYRLVLQLHPENLPALRGLAWILATASDAAVRDPNEAIPLARQACRLTGLQDASCLDALAVAQAAAGRYADARDNALKAIQLAKSAGRVELATEIEQRLALFEREQPYLEPPGNE